MAANDIKLTVIQEKCAITLITVLHTCLDWNRTCVSKALFQASFVKIARKSLINLEKSFVLLEKYKKLDLLD